MRTLLVLLFTLFMTSCGGASAVSLHPIDAKIPELRFWYMKNGSYVSAYGDKGDWFNVGDSKKFKIKLNKNAGNCQITYQEGDSNFTEDCKGLSDYELDVGTYSADQGKVIGFSVATEKLGIQQGFFYPNLLTQFPALPVTYKCPHSDGVPGLSVCARPATYNYNFIAQITDNFPGLLQYTEKCNSDVNPRVVVSNVTGAGPLSFSLISMTPQFCTVNLAVKQNQLPNGTYAIKKEQTIFIRFYDPQYIPLPIPTLTQTKTGWKACAVDEYERYSVNANDYGSGLFPSRCQNVNGNTVEIMVWDSIGRFSWNIAPGRILGFDDIGSEVTAVNNSDFYVTAKPFIQSELLKLCKKSDWRCMYLNHNKVMHDPRMIKAVEDWDAGLLYK